MKRLVLSIVSLAMTALGQTSHPEPERPTKVNTRDGLTYVRIPEGTYLMGCSPSDSECFDWEKPARKVTISKNFWIGKTEVTQEAYQRVTGTNPSRYRGAKLPVDQISWQDAKKYCEAVGMRLPTGGHGVFHLWFFGGKKLGKDARGFRRVDRHVPHASYRRSTDGVETVVIRNEDGIGPGFGRLLLAALMAGIWFWIVGGLSTGLVFAIALWLWFAYNTAVRRPTCIKFMPAAIAISDQDDGTQKFDRTAFHSFTILRPHYLAYSYGMRRASFGSCMPSEHVQEVSAQLNGILEAPPSAAEEPVLQGPRKPRSKF